MKRLWVLALVAGCSGDSSGPPVHVPAGCEPRWSAVPRHPADLRRGRRLPGLSRGAIRLAAQPVHADRHAARARLRDVHRARPGRRSSACARAGRSNNADRAVGQRRRARPGRGVAPLELDVRPRRQVRRPRRRLALPRPQLRPADARRSPAACSTRSRRRPRTRCRSSPTAPRCASRRTRASSATCTSSTPRTQPVTGHARLTIYTLDADGREGQAGAVPPRLRRRSTFRRARPRASRRRASSTRRSRAPFNQPASTPRSTTSCRTTHALGYHFFVERLGGPRDGESRVRLARASIGEARGRAYDPPLDLTGATGLRFGCDFDNPRDETVQLGLRRPGDVRAARLHRLAAGVDLGGAQPGADRARRAHAADLQRAVRDGGVRVRLQEGGRPPR